MMDNDVEEGVRGSYQDKPKTFPAMRSKSNTPWILRVLFGLNKRVYYLLLLLTFGALFYIGVNTSPVIVFVFSVCTISLLFSIYLTSWVLAKDEGPPEMSQISDAIRDGAEGFFRTQYGTISKMAILLAFVIMGIYLFRSPTTQQEAAGLERSTLAFITVISFLLGALCSGIAGYVGMWVSVRANVRVSSAARRSAREALQVATRAGGFSAIIVVGMAVIGVAVLYASFHVYLGVDTPNSMKLTELPLLLVGYGFGASFVALFAQLGGGIFTKAADVGADLVGKVEQGIPEDDPRNPAVIADLVGDNVGDCAARGADLFESIAAEVISAMILGGTMAKRCKIEDPSGFILFPLVVHSFDLIVSACGILSIRGTRDPSLKSPVEDPMAILQKGYSITIFLAVIAFAGSTRWLLYSDQAPTAWLHFALCGLVGIITAYLFVRITQYYTDYKYEPVRTLALSSSTGHGTNIIAGVSLGLESTALPVLVITVAIISAFWLGRTSGLVESDGTPTGGLFGTAVATMGMLSTAAYVLTMDMFGPIADNAGGIVEMSQQPESVREITDLLDAVVKVLSSFSQQGVKEFLNEVDLLSRINHRNLVSLLGYCNESREVMLIYEHMPGGSLRDHLYGPRAEHSKLNWKTRLKITLDAAQGLEYLHVGSTAKIIHRDVKTANILLDSNLNGKLADFGLSRMTIDEGATHVTTAVKGTFGYVDPEYFVTQMLTEKSDVYSFGVVLLEIICGRQPVDTNLHTEEVNIIRWVTPYVLEMDENPAKITEIVDKRLRRDYEMKSVNLVVKLAMRCVQAEPSCRPSVSEVVEELKNAVKHEDKASICGPEEIDIVSDDLSAGPMYLSGDSSEPKGTEWSDRSASTSKVGR